MHRPAAALLPIANIHDLIRIDARGTTTAFPLASRCPPATRRTGSRARTRLLRRRSGRLRKIGDEDRTSRLRRTSRKIAGAFGPEPIASTDWHRWWRWRRKVLA